MILIRNANIKTITNGDIENGQILIDGSTIAAVGKQLDSPADAQVIDAKGLLVTPGLVEGHCHLGVTERLGGNARIDHNEKSDSVTPQVRIMDSFNPQSNDVKDALELGGVTTAVVCPGSANVIGGTCMAVKLSGNRVDDMVIKNPVAMKMAMGENPKRCYGENAKKAPDTRMEIAFLLRDTLERTKRYLSDKENGKDPAYDAKLEAMIPVIRKEIPVKCHAHSANDIFTIIRIAKEYDLDLTIEHCTDGSLIADELAKEGYPLLVGPSMGPISKFELLNKGFGTVADVVKAGNRVAIITDSPVIQLEYLSLSAGLAIREGLDEENAWKAITINPASFYGLDGRIGSLEQGKDADLVIWTANPLQQICAKPAMVMVNGKVVFERN